MGQSATSTVLIIYSISEMFSCQEEAQWTYRVWVVILTVLSMSRDQDSSS